MNSKPSNSFHQDKRPADIIVEESAQSLIKHLSLVANKKIKLWKALLIVFFVAGFASAVVWSISTEEVTKSYGASLAGPGRGLLCRDDRECRYLICPQVIGGDKGKCDPKTNKCYCGGVCGDDFCDVVEKRDKTCPQDCLSPKIYEGASLKLISSKLLYPFSNNILIERIKEDLMDNWISKIYELENGELSLKSAIKGFVFEIIPYSEDGQTISEWFAIAQNNDLSLDKVWSATSLKGVWQRDYERERGFCLKGRPCQPEKDSADLVAIKIFNKDNWDREFITAGFPDPQPNASLDMMISWTRPFMPRASSESYSDTSRGHLYYGAEFPLDCVVGQRVPLSRQGDKIVEVWFEAKEEIFSPDELDKLGNRMVRGVLTKDDYLIYTGEGWVGKAPQDNSQGKWQFPLWHDLGRPEGKYLYAQGILEAKDLILVYGYDKNACSAGECMQLEISNDEGETFTSNETNLRQKLDKLIPDSPNTHIEHMVYDKSDDLIYFIIGDDFGQGSESRLFFMTYSEILSWVRGEEGLRSTK